MRRYPLLPLWICVAIAALFFIGIGVSAYGFGGDSFGNGKATPTPTPAPQATQTPAPTPPSLPISSSGVIGTDNQRCVDRVGTVTDTSDCQGDVSDYRWYYGGTGLNIGEKVNGGCFDPSNTPHPDTATPTPAPKAGRELPFTMYNDNTVQTCVNSQDKVVKPSHCQGKGAKGKLYYYPLRKGGKLYDVGEKVAGGTFKKPPKTDSDDAAAPAYAPTPLPTSDPDPVTSPTPAVKPGPEPAVPAAAATPEPAKAAEPKLALAKDNDNKLRPLTPDDIELVGKYAAVAAKPLEEMTPKVWHSAVRHQYALAFSKPIWPLALAGIAFWWVFFIQRRWHINDGCEDEERWAYMICIYIVPPLVTIVFGVIGLVRLSTSIARLIAPEYYAIQDFIQTLVK